MVLPNETLFLKKFGCLISLKEERIQQVLAFCKGRLLDIGCGENELVKRYRASGFSGIGIDIYPWRGVDILCNSEKLAFKNEEFETVSFVASLNHCPNREQVIQEAKTVLKRNGRIIVTMISPFIGFLCHKLAVKDSDQDIRGMKKGEKYGLSVDRVLKIFYAAGFLVETHKTFIYGLNHLFIFRKRS